jgi:hypothetical protein
MSDLFHYDGLISFSTLNNQRLKDLRDVVVAQGIHAEVQPTSLELSYQGRDAGRWVLRFLMTIASVIWDAEGEIVCMPNVEGSDPVYEFYQIKNGKVYIQEGRVVRGTRRELTPE